jgi:hypothetical protein
MLFTVNRHILLMVTDIMHRHFKLRKSVVISILAASDDCEKQSDRTADSMYFIDLLPSTNYLQRKLHGRKKSDKLQF